MLDMAMSMLDALGGVVVGIVLLAFGLLGVGLLFGNQRGCGVVLLAIVGVAGAIAWMVYLR
jgi:hypothetical protein